MLSALFKSFSTISSFISSLSVFLFFRKLKKLDQRFDFFDRDSTRIGFSFIISVSFFVVWLDEGESCSMYFFAGNRPLNQLSSFLSSDFSGT